MQEPIKMREYVGLLYNLIYFIPITCIYFRYIFKLGNDQFTLTYREHFLVWLMFGLRGHQAHQHSTETRPSKPSDPYQDSLRSYQRHIHQEQRLRVWHIDKCTLEGPLRKQNKATLLPKVTTSSLSSLAPQFPACGPKKIIQTWERRSLFSDTIKFLQLFIPLHRV